ITTSMKIAAAPIPCNLKCDRLQSVANKSMRNVPRYFFFGVPPAEFSGSCFGRMGNQPASLHVSAGFIGRDLASLGDEKWRRNLAIPECLVCHNLPPIN